MSIFSVFNFQFSIKQMTGKLIIFSAPSGSGKSTIINYLLKQNLNLASLLPKSSVVALRTTSFWNTKKYTRIGITER